MNKDILEKLLERTVLFFLSGIILVVLGASGGFTIGTLNLTVSEIGWRIFISVIGIGLIVYGGFLLSINWLLEML